MLPEIGNGYWFKSSDFEADPGEDEKTNPRMYGRPVVTWLHERFQALGYEVEDVFGKDWGWCVMCQRDPYWLWVGCANLRERAESGCKIARLSESAISTANDFASESFANSPSDPLGLAGNFEIFINSIP